MRKNWRSHPDEKTAVMEMAQAAGITLVEEAQRKSGSTPMESARTNSSVDKMKKEHCRVRLVNTFRFIAKVSPLHACGKGSDLYLGEKDADVMVFDYTARDSFISYLEDWFRV